jgi:hypothetical protein
MIDVASWSGGEHQLTWSPSVSTSPMIGSITSGWKWSSNVTWARTVER